MDQAKQYTRIIAGECTRFEVIAGNIGTVYDGPDPEEARRVYRRSRDEPRAGTFAPSKVRDQL